MEELTYDGRTRDDFSGKNGDFRSSGSIGLIARVVEGDGESVVAKSEVGDGVPISSDVVRGSVGRDGFGLSSGIHGG